MSINYLDKTGLAYFWGKIKARFVEKDGSKGLSTNDYTTAEKTKLAGIEAGANAYTLPTATASIKGGVKVGANLSINADGVLSASGGGIGAMVINASVPQFSDGETVTIESLDPEELEQAADNGKSVFLRLIRSGTSEAHILPLYRVIKSVIAPGSTEAVDRYSFGFATDKTTIKLLISVNGTNYTADTLYLKTLSASDLNAVGTAEKGAANGVCPLNAYGVIPSEYIPGSGDGIYVVHVSVDQLFGNPTGDIDELMGLSEHDNAILDITAPTPVSGHYTAYLSKRTVVNYYFTLFIHDKTENRLKVYIYEVSTSVGRITLDEKFTFVTEEE